MLQPTFVITWLICVIKRPIWPKKNCSLKPNVRYYRVSLYIAYENESWISIVFFILSKQNFPWNENLRNFFSYSTNLSGLHVKMRFVQLKTNGSWDRVAQVAKTKLRHSVTYLRKYLSTNQMFNAGTRLRLQKNGC